ncbi:MAG: hypothetical protein ACM3X6_00325 [Patescibacteria group bacterium]
MRAIKRRKNIGIVLLPLAFLAWSGLFGPLHAADVGVSPTAVVLQIQPGQTLYGRLRVDCHTAKTTVNAYVGDWSWDELGRRRFVPAGTVKRSLCGWIELSPLTFSLNPGRIQALQYRITAPQDITGSYWGIIFLESISSPQGPETPDIGLVARPRLGIPVYATTSRGAVVDGQPIDTKASWTPGKGLAASVTFKNTGNTIVTLKGQFEIVSKSGAIIAAIPFGKDPLKVLPDGIRLISLAWNEPIKPGNYVLRAVVDFGGKTKKAGQRSFKVQG